MSINVGFDSDRLYTPCPEVASESNTEQLIVTCDSCGWFHTRCCWRMEAACHYKLVVYTDGACSNNGRSGAVAGIGIAFGRRKGDPDNLNTSQFSFPVDDRLDPGSKRTNQRAELLAALEGLKKVCDHAGEWMKEWEQEDEGSTIPVVIITTDSEYVVKGMTEWLPNWKRNDLRKANGQRPSNLDLFIKLDAEVEKRERRHGCEVNFWHIDRAYNTIADRLAKKGARTAARAVNEGLGEVTDAMGVLVL